MKMIYYDTTASGTNVTTKNITFLTDVPSSVYADGNWHHYALEISTAGFAFYFDGTLKGVLGAPSTYYNRGLTNRILFSLGDEVMVCRGLLYNHRNFTPPDKPYTI